MYLKDIVPKKFFEDSDFDYKAKLNDGGPRQKYIAAKTEEK